MTASPAAMSTAVADAPPPPTTTPTAMPTTSLVELNLIYYYYLFIYHYVDCDVALLRCRHRRSIHAAATALPPPRCAPPPRFAPCRVGDTALGRLAEQRKKEFRLTARKFTEEEWAEILAARLSESNEATEYDNNGTFGEEEEV